MSVLKDCSNAGTHKPLEQHKIQDTVMMVTLDNSNARVASGKKDPPSPIVSHGSQTSVDVGCGEWKWRRPDKDMRRRSIRGVDADISGLVKAYTVEKTPTEFPFFVFDSGCTTSLGPCGQIPTFMSDSSLGYIKELYHTFTIRTPDGTPTVNKVGTLPVFLAKDSNDLSQGWFRSWVHLLMADFDAPWLLAGEAFSFSQEPFDTIPKVGYDKIDAKLKRIPGRTIQWFFRFLSCKEIGLFGEAPEMDLKFPLKFLDDVKPKPKRLPPKFINAFMMDVVASYMVEMMYPRL